MLPQINAYSSLCSQMMRQSFVNIQVLHFETLGIIWNKMREIWAAEELNESRTQNEIKETLVIPFPTYSTEQGDKLLPKYRYIRTRIKITSK